VRRFPENARRLTGLQHRRIQQGLEPHDWKPMATVGLGVREIRIRTELEHRILYFARFRDLICVIHAFEKRSRKTAVPDPELARQRLRQFKADRS
jgi:phage-related protein